MENSRINTLHYLRGLAALMVLVGHTLYFPFDRQIQERYFGALSYPLFEVDDIFFSLDIMQWLPTGYYPVATFFLLSGYLMELATRDFQLRAFLAGRIIRIYPVFWAGFLIHILAIFALGGEMPSVKEALNNFLLIDSHRIVEVSWTLLVEMRYYILIAIMLSFGLGPIQRVICFLIIFVLFPLHSFWFPYMALGMLIFHVKRGFEAEDWRAVGLYIFVLLSAACVWIVFGQLLGGLFVKFNIPLMELLFSFASLVIALCFGAVRWRSRVLDFFGDISYSLYATHLAVVPVVYYFFSSHFSLLVLAPIVISSCFPVAYLVHKFIEKPALKLSKKITHTAYIGSSLRIRGMI